MNYNRLEEELKKQTEKLKEIRRVQETHLSWLRIMLIVESILLGLVIANYI